MPVWCPWPIADDAMAAPAANLLRGRSQGPGACVSGSRGSCTQKLVVPEHSSRRKHGQSARLAPNALKRHWRASRVSRLSLVFASTPRRTHHHARTNCFLFFVNPAAIVKQCLSCRRPRVRPWPRTRISPRSSQTANLSDCARASVCVPGSPCPRLIHQAANAFMLDRHVSISVGTR